MSDNTEVTSTLKTTSNMPQLIQGFETLQYDRSLITEAVEKTGIIKVRCVLQRANKKNQNGRVYPRAILEREANYYKKLIQERRALGELDHPESAVINLKNVSHNISEMHFDGDDLVGEIEVLTTPSGNILKEFLKNGIRLGVSSRGLGSVKALNEADGGEALEVQDDFELLCFDIVSTPSTQGAFLQEGVDRRVATTNIVPTKYSKVDALILDFLNELPKSV